MYHYTYKTTNNITGKYYFGMHSTTNLDDGYLGSGRYLQSSLKKYGRENHSLEILEYYETREILAESEKLLITEETLKDPSCMNLCLGGIGGSGSRKGWKHNEETKLKISKTLKNSWESATLNGDRKHSDETKQKIRAAAAGTSYGAKKYILKNPNGEVLIILNLCMFCRDNNLEPRALSNTLKRNYPVLRGPSKGWQLMEKLS